MDAAEMAAMPRCELVSASQMWQEASSPILSKSFAPAARAAVGTLAPAAPQPTCPVC